MIGRINLKNQSVHSESKTLLPQQLIMRRTLLYKDKYKRVLHFEL